MMKKYIICSMLLAMAMAVQAQTRKEPQPEPPTAAELMAAYHFTAAEQQLKAEIAKLKRKRKPTADLEAQVAEAQRLARALDATQCITFVDSLLVPKKDFFEHFALSDESGRITTYARTFRTRDTLACTVYQPEMGSDAYYAKPVAGGTSRLCTSTLAAGDWSAAEPLAGLNADSTQNYPFMLADGVTLYYGAVNPDEGLGGWDIYTTRWDADSKRFLQPENLGMPFNSTANDYMMAIDELNNIGWFATDRRQGADTVCIYIFIPPTIRQNWVDTGSLQPGELASLGRIGSIAETQADAQAVADARKRLAGVRRGTHTKEVAWDFTFVVCEGRVCHFASDFRNAEARALAAKWNDADITLRASEQQLEATRRQYATAGESRQTQLRAQLLTMEREYEQQLQALYVLENEIREKESTPPQPSPTGEGE